MVEMIKNYFPNKPTVCSLGTGNKDALMMINSDISIEI
jgi:soluble P-type ATPase